MPRDKERFMQQSTCNMQLHSPQNYATGFCAQFHMQMVCPEWDSGQQEISKQTFIIMRSANGGWKGLGQQTAGFLCWFLNVSACRRAFFPVKMQIHSVWLISGNNEHSIQYNNALLIPYDKLLVCLLAIHTYLYNLGRKKKEKKNIYIYVLDFTP